MDAFGGGLSGYGNVCGAVVGGLAAIGLTKGRSEPGAPADATMRKVGRVFITRFREEVSENKLLCSDIINIDWTDANQVKAYRESDEREYCRILVGKTAILLGEMLEKTQAE
jgi:C_GCAxxG_C_C family probable redox protein